MCISRCSLVVALVSFCSDLCLYVGVGCENLARSFIWRLYIYISQTEDQAGFLTGCCCSFCFCVCVGVSDLFVFLVSLLCCLNMSPLLGVKFHLLYGWLMLLLPVFFRLENKKKGGRGGGCCCCSPDNASFQITTSQGISS